MFRKINISKKKQFYQEIPIENMRYLKQKENLSFNQNKCISPSYISSLAATDEQNVLEW